MDLLRLYPEGVVVFAGLDLLLALGVFKLVHEHLDLYLLLLQVLLEKRVLTLELLYFLLSLLEDSVLLRLLHLEEDLLVHRLPKKGLKILAQVLLLLHLAQILNLLF